ncbi:MAG: GHKL domain-containing protein [Zetaproteobacteria bacterium]|nr:GHKL domain-containing protein [Zetaproteobacteria bacterium]
MHNNILELPFAGISLDKEGNIAKVNHLAESHFGTSNRQLQQRPLSSWFDDGEHLTTLIAAACQGESSSATLWLKRPYKPLTLHIAPTDDEIFILLIDETYRIQAEDLRQQHAITDAVARIALEMAHEIKNPLAALRAAAQWLSESAKEKELEIALHMIGETDRIKDRIDTFLQLGPRANTAMEPINIHALIDAVTLSDIQANTMKLIRNFDPSIPPLMMHANRMRQAFENLWRNAIEANSTIIEWRTRITAANHHLLEHEGSVVEISICNDGKPIPRDLIDHIFDPFITSKQRGSGLGLAIVQRVIQEHHGLLKLNTHAQMTSFTIQLPLNRGLQ